MGSDNLHAAPSAPSSAPGQPEPVGGPLSALRVIKFAGLGAAPFCAMMLARAPIGSADGLIEGFRPGVMKRLGLGPEPFIKDNPLLCACPVDVQSDGRRPTPLAMGNGPTRVILAEAGLDAPEIIRLIGNHIVA